MALAYPKWDLYAFLGVDSDYYDAEVSVGVEDPPAEVDVGSAEGGNPTTGVGEVGVHTTKGTHDVTRETVLIMDDESEA